MADEEIRNQYRFTHHALVELYKLCRQFGTFKNGVEHQGADEGDVYASGVLDRVEAILRGEHPYQLPEPNAAPTDAMKALEAAENECWSIKCESYPTGGDDADVGWEVISHWQAKPQERVEGRGKTPLEALNDAIDKGESKRIAAARSR